MLRPALASLLASSLALACTSEQPSRLQQRGDPPAAPADAPVAAPAPATKQDAPAAPLAEAPAPAPSAGKVELSAEPPAGTELAEIRLSLREGSYRVTTVGNVQFSSMPQPTGFAREERLSLSKCRGEGYARSCTLEHRYVNFEAEPPSGRFLEADEAAVKDLVTRHSLSATGQREGATEIAEGPAEQAQGPAGLALAEVHRFYCIRFPEQPIGVGAKWRSTCSLRTGGVVDTRDVMWELSKLERDPDMGLRAEITYLGKYRAPGPKGTREGAIEGVLYFFVESGEPHLMREQFTTAFDSASAFQAKTAIAYQFARLAPGPDGKEVAVRTDGKPFPDAPALNEPPRPADAKKGDQKSDKKKSG